MTLEQLAAVPQIVFPESYDLRSAVDSAFRASDLAPAPVVAGAEMDAALRFVERGIGVAVVPAMVAVDRPALRTHLLADESLNRTVSIARRSDMALTNAAAALQRAIRSVADRLADPGAPTTGLVSRAG